jgi:hypothetical protein
MVSDRTSCRTRIVLGSSHRVSGMALKALAIWGAANGSAWNLRFKGRLGCRSMAARLRELRQSRLLAWSGNRWHSVAVRPLVAFIVLALGCGDAKPPHIQGLSRRDLEQVE